MNWFHRSYRRGIRNASNAWRADRALLMLVGAAVAFISIGAGTAVASGAGIQIVGRIPIDRPTGSLGDPYLYVDPDARRAFQIFDMSSGGIAIRAYDLDSLDLVREARLAIAASRDLVVVDSERGRLMIPYTTSAIPGISGVFDGVAVVDSRTLELSERWPHPPITDFLRSITGQTPRLTPALHGIGLYQPEGRLGPQKLLLLFQERFQQATNAHLVRNLVYIAQWDALSGDQDWAYPVNSCTTIFQYKERIFRSELFFRFEDEPIPSISLGCAASAGGGGLAVQIELTDEGIPNGIERSFPGPLFTQSVLSDPSSDRLFFGVSDEGKTSLFVFDGSRSSYVGVVGISKQLGVGFGIDSTSGRLYALTQDNGLVVVDGRRTPAQQGLVFQQFAGAAGDRISVDPASGSRPRRLLARAAANQFYWVIEDTIPVSTDTPITDLDSRTIDHEEQVGFTGRTFNSVGHAYGVRSLFVGGFQGVPQGDGRGLVRLVGSPCTRFDREVVAGLVSEASLTDVTIKAGSTAADADAGTKIDGSDPAGRCWPIPDVIGNGQFVPAIRDASDQVFRTREELLAQRDALCDGVSVGDDGCKARAGTVWPFAKAECAGDGVAESVGYAEPTGLGADYTGFYARSGCDLATQSVEGIARAAFEFPETSTDAGFTIPAVRVGAAVSNVAISLGEGGLGVVGVAEAEARNVQILGVGTIELIRSRATSQAAGRPGTARTTFDRVVCGVVLSNYTQPGCVDADVAVAQLNQALGARGRAQLPEPDRDLSEGTPGGYLASVQKDLTEELASRALSNDFTTQVPGLEITFFNDHVSFGRARQIFQFAGVDISTTYAIFLLGSAVPTDDVITTRAPVTGPRFVTIEVTDQGGGGSGGPTTETRTVIEKVREGLTFLARSPGQAITAIAVWMSLLLPVFMGIRRLAFLSAIGGGR